MKTSIVILISAMVSIANAGLFGTKNYGIGEERELAKAILANSLEPVKTFIKDKPEIGELGAYKEDSSKLALWLATNDSAWSSGNALSYSVKRPENICRPEVVKLLIADGVTPSEGFKVKGSDSNGHLSGAVKSFCKQSFDLIMAKSSAGDIATASKQINFTMLMRIKNDETLAPSAVSILQALIASNQKNCKANVSAACESEKYLKEQMTEFMDSEKAVIHSQTPEGQAEQISEEICKATTESKQLESALKEEKEKSKISGVTNMLKLKTTGDRLYEVNKAIESKSSEYRMLTKKSFNQKTCK